MDISPDTLILARVGPLELNATLAYSWVVMAILVIGSWLITRRLSSGIHISRWQNLLEVVVLGINGQIREISRQDPGRYLPFIGTLFLYIALSNVLAVVPGYHPPTASLSTSAALAASVLVAVPIYGIVQKGLGGFLRHYLQPSALMLPFNVLGELTHTLSLAVRLFGNMMSEGLIAAILLTVAPFLLPVAMKLLGLLIGLVQAYVFAALAMVYIASATEAHPARGAARCDPTGKKGT
jgi:F-type H+-transporting ATPase subunit a